MSIPADICAFTDNKTKPEEIEHGWGTRGKLRRNKGTLTLGTDASYGFHSIWSQTANVSFIFNWGVKKTHVPH